MEKVNRIGFKKVTLGNTEYSFPVTEDGKAYEFSDEEFEEYLYYLTPRMGLSAKIIKAAYKKFLQSN